MLKEFECGRGTKILILKLLANPMGEGKGQDKSFVDCITAAHSVGKYLFMANLW